MSDLIPGPGDRPPPVPTATAAGAGTGSATDGLLADAPLAAGSDRQTSPTAPTENGPGDPAAPAPLGVPRAPTGNTAVDAVLERLADADHLPAEGHLAVYEDVHRGLRDTLTALDAPQPGPSAPGPQSPPYDHRS
ncbi:hypothetical protein ABZ348_25020 [Streptomyces sp. NPDC005963]|uniref:hypothetical protein n=1 Tax=Streptomyces sp. NPDC005963 TaxID=3156721 RepID=UPI0033F6A90E